MDALQHLTTRCAVLSLVAIALVLSGCADDWSAMNRPDNELVTNELGANNLGQAFAQTQYNGMFGSAGNHQSSQITYANLYSQIEAEQAGSFDTGQYLINSGWLDGTWNTFYTGVAPQIQFVREFTRENEMPVMNAVANVWRVYLYHRITDYWGPIIYSSFGSDSAAVSYDSQESIYRDFFTQLEDARGVLQQNRGENAFGSNDLIYEGNANQWLTFANTLQLRLALRVKYAVPDLAQQEAEEAVDAGVMTDNSQNAMVLTTENNRNPLMTFHDWNEHRMSAAMESLLEGYEDPRAGVYWSEVGADASLVSIGDKDGDGSLLEGMRKGVPRANKGDRIEAKYSARGQRYWRPALGGVNPPIPVMRAAEAYFLRAEGALEGWAVGGTAEDLYNQGIRTSMREDRFDVTTAEIDAYVSRTSRPVSPGDSAELISDEYSWAKSPVYPDTPPLTDIPVDFQTGADQETKLEQIITQKWLALHNDGWELWAEIRRTGYPRRYPIIESRSPVLAEDELPQRVPFVQSEYSNNTDAVQGAVEVLDGPDEVTTELWWDQKSGPDYGNVTYPSSQ